MSDLRDRARWVCLLTLVLALAAGSALSWTCVHDPLRLQQLWRAAFGCDGCCC